MNAEIKKEVKEIESQIIEYEKEHDFNTLVMHSCNIARLAMEAITIRAVLADRTNKTREKITEETNDVIDLVGGFHEYIRNLVLLSTTAHGKEIEKAKRNSDG